MGVSLNGLSATSPKVLQGAERPKVLEAPKVLILKVPKVPQVPKMTKLENVPKH